jgi:hypothetical protein
MCSTTGKRNYEELHCYNLVMTTGTMNLLFYADENDMHLYYFVEGGKKHILSDRFLESELPERLKGMRYLGVQSVYIYLFKELPNHITEWMDSDETQKQLKAQWVAKLLPKDSVESWVERVHEELGKHQAKLGELSITALRAG